VSSASRVPRHTAQYYRDPANIGNPNLLSERAWSYTSEKLRGKLVAFHRRESNVIDYVSYSLTRISRATNIRKLRLTGVEASVRLKSAAWQQIDLRYRVETHREVRRQREVRGDGCRPSWKFN
jgi:outer membrane cobalamin receptor